MPRPKKTRFVSAYPTIAAFVPQGVPLNGEVYMSIEEVEAIRLSDFEHLDQESAANLMEISRHTFGRILGKARSTIAEAIVTGKALKIEGGNYEFRSPGGGRKRRRRRCQTDSNYRGPNHDYQEGGAEMPRMDGSGPKGNGPATGRGLGGCKPTSTPPNQGGGFPNQGNQNSGLGQGRGTGQGGGFGQGRGTGQGGGFGQGRGSGQGRGGRGR